MSRKPPTIAAEPKIPCDSDAAPTMLATLPATAPDPLLAATAAYARRLPVGAGGTSEVAVAAAVV